MKTTIISERFKAILLAGTFSMGILEIIPFASYIIAGNLLGEESIAAMSLTHPMIRLMEFVGELLAAGSLALISYASGRGEQHEVNHLYSQTMFLAVTLGATFSIVMLLFREPILSFWEVSPTLTAYATEFFGGLIILPTLEFLSIFLSSLLLIQGEESLVAKASAVQLVAGVVLQFVLCKMFGLFGLSLAMSLSTALVVAIDATYLFSERCPLKFDFYLSVKKLREIFGLSFCVAMPELFLAILPVVVNTYLIAMHNEAYITIFAVLNSLLGLAIAMFFGMDDVLQSLACTYIGERNFHGVQKVMSLCVKTALFEGVLVALLLLAGANFVPTIFAIDNPNLFQPAVDAVRIYSVFLGTIFFTLTYAFYYMYVERKLLSILLQSLLLFLLPIACVHIFGDMFGLNGVWFGLGLGIALEFPINVLLVKLIDMHSDGKLTGLLMIEREVIAQQVSYDIMSTQDEVLSLVHKLQDDLVSWQLPERKLRLLELFVEEIGMDAVDRAKNIGENFHIEITITNDAQVELIVRDNGELADVTDMNNAPESFRRFIVSQVAEHMPFRSYMLIGGENRIVIKI